MAQLADLFFHRDACICFSQSATNTKRFYAALSYMNHIRVVSILEGLIKNLSGDKGKNKALK